MTAYILRRKKLGKTSCEAIVALSKEGIKLFRNDAKLPEDADLCIRWGCTSNVPQKNVINSAKAIHLVSDKTTFREMMDEHKLCPKTFTDEEVIFDTYNWESPLIVRPRVHHQGRNLYVCHGVADLMVAASKCGDGWYAGQFIDKVAEYRVFCMSGRVLAVAKKTPADEKAVAWNVAQGGRFDNVRWDDWPLKAVKVSLKAFALSGLDFGGVDIMVDKDGGCFVLEINSAPSLTSPYRQECMAKGMDYIVKHGKAVIPMSDKPGGYLKFIHPAVCDRAF